MTSQQIEKQIAQMTERRADITTQQATAADENRAAQKAFARGKTTLEIVTTAQAKLSGISGALGYVDEEMTAKQIEYSIAVADEKRAAQLVELTAKVEAANQCRNQYGDAQAQAVRALEIAAKTLLDSFQKYDVMHTETVNFLAAPETVVKLNDLDIDTAGATQTLAFYGAPIGVIPDGGEDGFYLKHLHELMVFVNTCKDSCRPCPTP